MLLAVGCVAALVVSLGVTAAVADVTMSPSPAISLTWAPDEADPADAMVMASSYGYTFYYTVSDHDTFTPSAPPPPPPPYNGPSFHDDNTKMTDFSYDETAEDILGYVVTGGDWTHERHYGVWVGNNNDTGILQYASITPEWDDQALGPMGVPGNQVYGSADDDLLTFTKQLLLLP